ncbi:MAG: class I adenylate-forming enzyme family protein [Magnetovibrionaceae bacterium]
MSTVFQAFFGDSLDTDRPLILGANPKTYGEVRQTCEHLIEVLGQHGCRPGERVGIALDQGEAYLASLLAVRKAGCVAVLLFPHWTAFELDYVLDHAAIRVVISSAAKMGSRKAVCETALSDLGCKVQSFDGIRATESDLAEGVIIYTSGTTGKPKGVVLSEAAVSANARAVARYLDLGPDDQSPVFTPSCYALSLSQNLAAVAVGAALYPVETGLRFPSDIMTALSREKLNGLTGDQTSLSLLMQTGVAAKLDFSHVRYVSTGGRPLHEDFVAKLNAVFPNAALINFYGCSENSPRISYFYLDGDKAKGRDQNGYYAVGKPVEGSDFRVGDEHGNALAEGETGEIWITGTSLMSGYLNDPENTRKRLLDGWFRTQDIGYIDENQDLHVTGRLSNIINVAHLKVSPEEVEMVLMGSDSIEEVAAYGVDDPLLGSVVHAAVVLREDAELDEAALQAHCRRMLSPQKVPQAFFRIDAVPKNLYGKIDRKALMKAIAPLYETAGG